MSLNSFLDQLVKVEEAITLPASSSRQRKTIVKAYREPPNGQSLTNLPCFLNWFDGLSEELRLGNFTEAHETIRVEFYAPISDMGSRYVTEFYDATLAAFRAQQPYNRRFGNTVGFVSIRSEGLQELTWGGLGYAGFRMFLDVIVFETVVPV